MSFVPDSMKALRSARGFFHIIADSAPIAANYIPMYFAYAPFAMSALVVP